MKYHFALGSLLDKTCPEAMGVRGVYFISNNEDLLYIGRTFRHDIIWRINTHVYGSYPIKSSKVGQACREALPVSREWVVDVWDLDECNTYFHERGMISRRVIGRAENALIKHFLPLYNGEHHLPEKYMRKVVSRHWWQVR